MKNLFSTSDKKRIAAAIAEAERHTSSEIKIHIADQCNDNPVNKAIEVFNQLGMYNTKDRNAVLIFLSVNDKKFAIIGDEAIDIKVGYLFWDNLYVNVTPFFKAKKYTDGLIFAIKNAGMQLQKYFPVKDDDTNELSNEISFENIH